MKSDRTTSLPGSGLLGVLWGLLGLLMLLTIGGAATLWAAQGGGSTAGATITGQETAVLSQAPFVSPPITRDHSTKVIVHLEVREVVQRLADGVEYYFWTFGGRVPGNLSAYDRGIWPSFISTITPAVRCPEYRSARRHRSWRRGGGLVYGPGPWLAVLLSGAQPGAVCLSLCHCPGGDAYCQWYVRGHSRLATGRIAPVTASTTSCRASSTRRASVAPKGYNSLIWKRPLMSALLMSCLTAQSTPGR